MTNKQLFGVRVFLSLCLLAIFATSAIADTAPNGKTYTVMRDGLYYNLINGSAPYYELVDADYTENLVVPDAIDDIIVKKVSNLTNRMDIETATFGPNVTNINMSGCTYLSSIDITRCESLDCDFSNTAIVELTLPANIAGKFRYNGSLEKVTFLGDIKSCDFSSCGALKTVVWNDNVTVMPYFIDCKSLTSIDIPAHVKKIPGNCFYNCESLSQVNFPDNSEADILDGNCFYGTNIKQFDCPPNIKKIYSGAFSGTPIEEFKIPENLTVPSSIYAVFDGCKNLRKIVYPSLDALLNLPPNFRSALNSNGGTEIYIGDELLTELTLPANKDFPNGFAYTSGLKTVKISNGLSTQNLGSCFTCVPTLETVEIGAGAQNLAYTFAGCTNLKTVTVSSKNKTTSLLGTFNDCSSLESISFPNVTTTGGSYNIDGFRNCTSLVSLDLPKATEFYCSMENCTSLVSVNLPMVTTLHANFNNCTSLVSLSLPELTTIKGGSLYPFENCTALETLDFPKLTTMTSTFSRASALKKADFPSLVSNNKGMFSGCTSLESVNLPQITELTDEMFSGCSSLKEVKLKNAISDVPHSAFSGCSSLSEFDFSNVKSIYYCAFQNTALAEVSLPDSCRFVSNAFWGCQNLKSFTGTCYFFEYNTTEIAWLNALEKINLKVADERITLRIMYLNTEQPCDITINGSPSRIEINNIPNLNRLEINGAIKQFECKKATPKIFAIDNIENYLGGNFTNDGVPGYSTSTGEIDLYIGGEKVTNLCIPAGSTLKNKIFKGFAIEKVTFMEGDEPTVVQNDVFRNCTNLREAEFLGNVTSLGDYAFTVTGFETFNMPSTVTNLGVGCFDCCGNLKHVTFSPSLTTIPSGTFFNCASLEDIIVPEGVETMGYMVSVDRFNKNLKYVSLPSTFKELSNFGYPTFDGISSDAVIYSWSKTAPYGSKDDFSKITVHVPVGCKDAYAKTRPWTASNIIDDLLVDNTVAVSGKNVTINVPRNAGMDTARYVARYVVYCYYNDSTASEEPIAIYEFDDNGEIIPTTRSYDASLSLNIPDLEEDKEYRFDIKGYTRNSDLVYSVSNVVKTETQTGINSALVSQNSIRLLGKTLLIPASYASQVMRICNTDGAAIITRTIGNNGEAIELPLTSGIYVVSIGNTALKFRIQ